MLKIAAHHARILLLCAAAAAAIPAQAQSRNLAPGFVTRPTASTIVIVPADMELFSMTAGGVLEPKADWTQAAQKNFKSGLQAQSKMIGARAKDLTEADMDDFAQINALHGAVADSVFLHHMLGSALKLPTKNDQLDWSMGEAVKPLRDKTGADYALFFWVRDSYASSERKVAMVALALLGVGISAGTQVAYASLVDLRDGRVVWFNVLRRAGGDLREPAPALETVESLLEGFPALQ